MIWNRSTANARTAPETAVQVTLENIPAASLIVDDLGRVRACNVRAALLLERSIEEIHTMTVVELVGRDLFLTSTDQSAQVVPVAVTLPSTRRIRLLASISDATQAMGTARMVILTPPQSADGRGGDALPGVVSWAHVAERVSALRTEAVCVALGVPGLQGVNDGFSRSTGDFVLSVIHRRLGDLCPSSTIIERVAGTSFFVVSPSDRTGDGFISEINAVIRQPIETPLGEVVVGCSAGVATGPSRPPLVLLDRADRNLTVALERGTGIFESDEMPRPAATSRGARLGAPLARALVDGGISAHFQPVIELATGRVVEFEALARLDDGSGKCLDAHHIQFRTVANDTGLIKELGERVLVEAIELLSRIQKSFSSHAPRVSLNVSSAELVDRAFADRVISMLGDAGVDPASLQFDLIDVVRPMQRDLVDRTMKSLQLAGVRFAVAGFGNQSGSLLTVRDHEIDVVKLDQAMTAVAKDCQRSTNMLRAVLAVAAELDVTVVAQGIETAEQHELLRHVGCQFAQGTLYSFPLPMSDLALGVDLDLDQLTSHTRPGAPPAPPRNPRERAWAPPTLEMPVMLSSVAL